MIVYVFVRENAALTRFKAVWISPFDLSTCRVPAQEAGDQIQGDASLLSPFPLLSLNRGQTRRHDTVAVAFLPAVW